MDRGALSGPSPDRTLVGNRGRGDTRLLHEGPRVVPPRHATRTLTGKPIAIRAHTISGPPITVPTCTRSGPPVTLRARIATG